MIATLFVYGFYALGVASGRLFTWLSRGFYGVKQNPFGFGRTVESGFFDKFRMLEADFLQQSQEILSRYGPALSPKPIGKPRFEIFLNAARRRLIGRRQPAAGF